MSDFDYERCFAFAAAIDVNYATEAEVKAEVLRLVDEHGLTVSDFLELDERPAQFHVADRSYTDRQSNWHRNLRITRNDRDSDLFGALKCTS